MHSLGQVVAVVGAHQGDACLVVELEQPLVDDLLVPDAVVLELQIEIPLSKEVLHLQGVFLCAVIGHGEDAPGDLTGQTRRQGDEPLVVLPEQIHVDAGPDIESLRIPQAHHIA